MSPGSEAPPVGIQASGCVTAFGAAGATLTGLVAGHRALRLLPVLGAEGGDRVPLGLIGAPEMNETEPPQWLSLLTSLAADIPPEAWGTARFPVVVTSSNFGVGGLYAYLKSLDANHLRHGAPYACVERLRREFGWGEQVHILSHACVSAHLGLLHATRLLEGRLADRVLVFTFDFVSPFVAGGFHSLKILNANWPAPYAAQPVGSIGLGDGAAFAVLTRDETPFRLEAQTLHNEMHHFTGNQSDGAGFAACAGTVAAAARGRRLWVKGHGTGTLEAGRLEAEAYARALPGSPLVSWKGSLGHTLGSCGLVELALTIAAFEGGQIPGTVGSSAPCFTDTVALTPFAAAGYDGAVIASNAFGGAHAALILSHA